MPASAASASHQPGGSGTRTHAAGTQKFFGSFFQKRTAFFLLLAASAQASPKTEATARLTQTEHQRAAQRQAEATAQRDLAGAEAQAARLADIRAQQAAALQQIDSRILAASARLSDAEARRHAAEATLADTQHEFAALLPAMLLLSRDPDLAVLAAPGPPSQVLQGLLVTRGLAVTLNRQAALLRTRQADAAAARAAAAAEAGSLAHARAEQGLRAAALDRAVAGAREQVGEAETAGRVAAEHVAEAGAQARTLREAIAAMEAAQLREAARAAEEEADATRQHRAGGAQAAHARQAALARPAGPALAQSAGLLAAPVAGPVTRGFGEAAEDGPATGITYAPAPGAFVDSPCRGRVAFAAPFRSYGQLLIVECGGGYDFVLAGLGTLAARPGHPARAGEPLGRMPATGKPALYVELRLQGRPVDPAPFLQGKL